MLYSAFITGVASGTLGLGGGMILGVYMLDLGIHPYICTAISGFTLVFLSLSTTLQFAILGMIQYTHSKYMMLMSAIGSLIGVFVLNKLLKSYNRPSTIVWVVIFVLSLSFIVMCMDVIFNFKDSKSNNFTFGVLC